MIFEHLRHRKVGMGLKKEDEDDIGQESILIKILDVINRFVLIYNQMFHLTAQAF